MGRLGSGIAGGQRVEHSAVRGADQPIEEAADPRRSACWGDGAGVLHLFQDEGAQEDLAAGIQAALGLGGPIEAARAWALSLARLAWRALRASVLR
jgi:hypothetical protein